MTATSCEISLRTLLSQTSYNFVIPLRYGNGHTVYSRGERKWSSRMRNPLMRRAKATRDNVNPQPGAPAGTPSGMPTPNHTTPYSGVGHSYDIITRPSPVWGCRAVPKGKISFISRHGSRPPRIERVEYAPRCCDGELPPQRACMSLVWLAAADKMFPLPANRCTVHPVHIFLPLKSAS